ncbi:hypothetical protein MNBD_GAMMA02-622 [hydrothermal vent metagenome]|uniref:Uncharacterized protein n=1 Tax=hydrothermal vent metagenome TaxID=652676 RepID=A0A3B0VLT3_9ZZZZ
MTVLKPTLFLLTLLCTQPLMAVTEIQKSAVRTALQANDWDSAMDLAEGLVDDFPESSAAHYLLASAIRVKMQEVSQVRAMFSLGDYKESLATAIELDPKNIDARSEEIGFYLFAPGIAGGDKELAAEKIKALKLVDAFSGMEMEAQLAGVNKDVNKQQQLLHEMLSIKPNNASTLMQLAGMKIQQKNHNEADKLLLKINAEKDAGWPLFAQYQRAKWRILAKQESDLAIELLQDYQSKLVTVETEIYLPSESAVLWRMALAYENKGDINKAIELLNASLKADKDFESAEDDLDRLSD